MERLEDDLKKAYAENEEMTKTLKQNNLRIRQLEMKADNDAIILQQTLETHSQEIKNQSMEIKFLKEDVNLKDRNIASLKKTLNASDYTIEQVKEKIKKEQNDLKKCLNDHKRLKLKYERVLTRLGPLNFSVANDTRTVPILGKKRLDISISEIDICDPGRGEIIIVYENGVTNKLVFYGTNGLYIMNAPTKKFFKSSDSINGIALFAGFSYVNTYCIKRTNRNRNTWHITIDTSDSPLIQEVIFTVRRVTQGGLRNVTVQDYYNHALVNTVTR